MSGDTGGPKSVFGPANYARDGSELLTYETNKQSILERRPSNRDFLRELFLLVSESSEQHSKRVANTHFSRY